MHLNAYDTLDVTCTQAVDTMLRFISDTQAGQIPLSRTQDVWRHPAGTGTVPFRKQDLITCRIIHTT